MQSGLVSPPLQLWEVAAHHLFVFFAGQGFGHLLVHLVDKLGAVLNHFFHGAVLQEFAFLVAIAAVVLVDASVGVGAEVLRLHERHPTALAELGLC